MKKFGFQFLLLASFFLGYLYEPKIVDWAISNGYLSQPAAQNVVAEKAPNKPLPPQTEPKIVTPQPPEAKITDEVLVSKDSMPEPDKTPTIEAEPQVVNNEPFAKDQPITPAIPAEKKVSDLLFLEMNKLWEDADFVFTDQVRDAYLVYAKAITREKIKDAGIFIPDEFIAEVSNDPIAEATIFADTNTSAQILTVYYQLSNQVGEKDFSRYNSLMLAAAHNRYEEWDKPYDSDSSLAESTLDPPSPLNPVTITEPEDANDHVIHFLNTNTVKEAKRGTRYTKKESLTGKQVMCSLALQERFNRYMEEHGQATRLHLVEAVTSGEAPPAAEGKLILENGKIFKDAYIAKGLLPAERDPMPTTSQICKILIRNHKARVSAGIAWPWFPLEKAPWPLMDPFFCQPVPLREANDVWAKYRKTGEHTLYGNYIDGIAQQPLLVQAANVAPIEFGYGSLQMNLKDGGVCGVMAKIEQATRFCLGSPALFATQPGHANVVYYTYDHRSKEAVLNNAQSIATEEETGVTGGWGFSPIRTAGGRPFFYRQSIAHAVSNDRLLDYLNGNIASRFLSLQPRDQQVKYGVPILTKCLDKNPYNFNVIELANSIAEDPVEIFELLLTYTQAHQRLGRNLTGSAKDLGVTYMRESIEAKLASLPFHKEKMFVKKLYTYLKKVESQEKSLMLKCRLVEQGERRSLAIVAQRLKEYLRTERTLESSLAMKKLLETATDMISQERYQIQWLESEIAPIIDSDSVFLEANKDKKKPSLMRLDECVIYLDNKLKRTPKPLAEHWQALLPGLTKRFQDHVNLRSKRNPDICEIESGQIQSIYNQFTKEAKDHSAGYNYISDLSLQIKGHETYKFNPGKKSSRDKAPKMKQDTRDLCADVIDKILNASAPVE